MIEDGDFTYRRGYTDVEGHDLRLPPMRSAIVTYNKYDPDLIFVDMYDTRKRACSSGHRGKDCMCMVEREQYGGNMPAKDPRAAVVIAYIGDLLHEALEWTTFDGHQLVSPHAVASLEWHKIVHEGVAAILENLQEAAAFAVQEKAAVA